MTIAQAVKPEDRGRTCPLALVKDGQLAGRTHRSGCESPAHVRLTTGESDWREGSGFIGKLLGAVLALAVVAAFGCAAVGTPAAEDESELAERAADPAKTAAGAPAVPQDEAQSAVTDEDFEEEMIASGRASGLAWRLFTLSAEPAQFLCLEVEGRPSFECAAALVSSWNPSGGSASSEVTLPPTLSVGDPAFVFGALGSPVASVVVELEVGEPVEAEVVGEDKSHYLAVLPPDTTPIHVVLYGPHGQELGRLDFMGDESGEGSWVDSWEQECGPTDDGGYACEGRASGGGYVSRTGGIEGYDETRP